jgi:hypothetical protein
MAYKMDKPVWHGTDNHKEALSLNKSMDQSSLPDGRPKSSAFQKAGCVEGDPGCGGNFKVKKKSRISRALKQAGRWIGSELRDLKGDIRRSKSKRKRRREDKKRQKAAKGMGWDSPRYLAGPGNKPIPGTKAAR